MAEEPQQIIVDCPDCPEVNVPDSISCELSELDRKIYLAGCALTGIINNKTHFEKGEYPYDEDAQYCARWADAVLAACGAGGSPQGGGGSGGGSGGSGSPSASGFGCGASAGGNGSNCTGTATCNPTGGTPPYSYKWNTGETTQTISNKCSGTYTVTCKDSTGKTTHASCVIS